MHLTEPTKLPNRVPGFAALSSDVVSRSLKEGWVRLYNTQNRSGMPRNVFLCDTLVKLARQMPVQI